MKSESGYTQKQLAFKCSKYCFRLWLHYVSSN